METIRDFGLFSLHVNFFHIDLKAGNCLEKWQGREKALQAECIREGLQFAIVAVRDSETLGSLCCADGGGARAPAAEPASSACGTGGRQACAGGPSVGHVRPQDPSPAGCSPRPFQIRTAT